MTPKMRQETTMNVKSRIRRLENARNNSENGIEVWVRGSLPDGVGQTPAEPFQGYDELVHCPHDSKRVGEFRPRSDWPEWPERLEAL